MKAAQTMEQGGSESSVAIYDLSALFTSPQAETDVETTDLIDEEDKEEATPTCEDESQLVLLAIDGDDSAFGELYSRYYDRIYRYVYWRVGRRTDAEDLAQSVFMQAWKAIGRYHLTGSPFVAWLHTIAHNSVVSYYRRARKEHSLENEIVDLPSKEQLERNAETHFEYERVQSTLERLRPTHQRVLRMRFVEDLSYRELADALGKTEANIRVIQHRALNELRQLMDERSDGKVIRSLRAARRARARIDTKDGSAAISVEERAA